MDWDEAEYNYFMSLDDMTKVYYLHDYLYGELGEDQFEDTDYDDTPMFDSIPEERKTIIDIFLDFVKADNTIINKEGLEYLNKLWKDKP